MTIIAIGGEPATGKSTLMRAIIKELGTPNISDSIRGLPYTVVENVCILGYYEEEQTFGGTDRYAMDVQPRAVEALPILVQMYTKVLFEGDRLFNVKFLEECRKYGLVTFLLETPEETKKARHLHRSDTQNESWLKGRITKLQNILKYNNATRNRYGVQILPSRNEDDILSNREIILKEIQNEA